MKEKLSEKPRPYGNIEFRCRLCGEGFTTEHGLNTHTGLCQDCTYKIKNDVIKKVESLGKKWPKTSPTINALRVQLDEYSKSGVPEEAIKKYTDWFFAQVDEYKEYEIDLMNACVEAYNENDLEPVLLLLNVHKELQDE